MHLNIPKRFPTNWAELSAQAKVLLTPSHDHKKQDAKGGHEDESEAHQVFRSVAGHSKLSSGSKSKRHQKVKTEGHAKKEGAGTVQQINRTEEVVAKKEEAIAAEAASDSDEHDDLPGISSPGSTGVIFVMDRAMANGFSYDDPEWANFGQG